jgi:hypothetical protein
MMGHAIHVSPLGEDHAKTVACDCDPRVEFFSEAGDHYVIHNRRSAA